MRYLKYRNNQNRGQSSIEEREKNISMIIKNFEQHTLRSLAKIAKLLGVERGHYSKSYTYSEVPSLQEAWFTLVETIEKYEPKIKQEIVFVPGYSTESMLGQPRAEFTSSLKNTAPGCTSKNFSNVTSFEEVFLEQTLCMDEWYGHMVFGPVHLLCSILSLSKYKLSSGEKVTLKDIATEMFCLLDDDVSNSNKYSLGKKNDVN